MLSDWDPDYLSDEPPVEGPPIPITSDMILRKLSLNEDEKAQGPSGIVVEIIRAAGDMGASMICDQAAAIICNCMVLSDRAVLLSASTRVRGMHGKGETNVV